MYFVTWHILFFKPFVFILSNDPFGERTDDELWNSLELFQMKTMVLLLPGALDSQVLNGGSNFSSGQRQLLCLARAVLRSNRILIMDEATANIDSETDRMIQETIRLRFAKCTVITIAHRLHTVMESDKVLVIDAGEIVEFDHPYKLIQKPDGFFKRLLDQTGNLTAMALTHVAKQVDLHFTIQISASKKDFQILFIS